MLIIDFITELFCKVDDILPIRLKRSRHKQRQLHPSEIITLGLLFAIKGVNESAFYRWIKNNYLHLFPNLPDRTNLFRNFNTYWQYAEAFMSNPTIFGIADSYGIELIHPMREGRSDNQIGKKGKSNHRWIVGLKICPVINKFGLIVDWSVSTDNVCDKVFQPMIKKYENRMIVFTDTNFNDKDGNASNMKVCPRGTWNGRMVVESVFSMLSNLCHYKKTTQRTWKYFLSKMAYTMAAFNILAQWNGLNPDENGFVPLSIAHVNL